MFTYKNTSDSDLVIPNVGTVAAGKTIDSEIELFNDQLELVKERKESRKDN